MSPGLIFSVNDTLSSSMRRSTSTSAFEIAVWMETGASSALDLRAKLFSLPVMPPMRATICEIFARFCFASSVRPSSNSRTA
ncbi:conserved hypothetical protein, partial [Ricinus communis]